jgi:hypothetical protein
MRGLRLLTLAPQVDERDGVLRARTPILIRLLSLGMVHREVVVDRRSRYVTIDERYFWLVKHKRVIPFRQIHRLEYDYERTTTSLRRGYSTVETGDEVESFRVGLVLRPRADVPDSHAHLYEERVHLFGFHGDGRGQAISLDFEGQQEALSLRYVERLRALIGVGFGNELPQLRDEIGRAWSCEQCKRPGPPRPGRCYYCGAALVANSDAG